MSAVVKPITIKRGLRAAFVKAFANGEDPAEIQPFLMQTDSDGPDEEYGWLGQAPSMSEWIDERKLKALNDFEYRIPNKDYEATMQVDRNAIMDDRLGNVQIRIDDLARKARIHPRTLFFQTLVEGETELCYDGQPFFSTSHQEGESPVQSNLVTGTGTTLAQLKADIDNAEAVMLSYRDDVNEPWNEGEVQIGIVCHPKLKRKFEELNTLARINDSDNGMRGRISQIVYSSRLPSEVSWYIADTSAGMKPIIQQNRMSPMFDSLEGESESGFMSKRFKYGINYRVGFGYGLWQKMIKVTN